MTHVKLGPVVVHVPPLRRVDLTHIGRPRIITREEIDDNIRKEPCAEAYKQDAFGNWHLKDSAP